MRYRQWVLALLAFGVVVAAGVATGGTTLSTSPASAAAAEPGSSAARQALRGKKRPGCRRFCQQAGGFGAGDEEGPVQVPAQRIGGTRDRIVAVRSTCDYERDCVGAIILSSFRAREYFEYGRADLEIPAGATKKVKVGISRAAKRWLREHGDDSKAYATIPLIYDDVPVSFSAKLRVLAP